ncbi:MAG: TonB-dependent siderophore receptor [Bacteroidales bacterium]
MRIKLLLLFLLLNSTIFAQTIFKGRVTDNTKEPLAGVTVMVKNTTIGTFTGADGTFELRYSADAPFALVLSSLGYNTREMELSPQSAASLGDIVLMEGNEILNEVVVTGERTNKFSRKETAYVAKLPLKDIDNTQVYSTITNELLESQVITNFDDAMKNSVGVKSLWESTGRGGDGAGYYSLRGFSLQPQLVNGLPGLTNGTINPANIERIEVLKGPSATLFGTAVSSYGGLINVVTKKPYVGQGGELSYTGGSFGFNQVVLDLNSNVGGNEKLYFRINTAYTTQQSFQDAGFNKTFFIAPSLSYRVNNRLSFSFYGEITQAEQTNPTFLFLNRSNPLKIKSIDELNINNELSFTSNDLTLKNPTQNYRGEMLYKLSDNWQSQTLISASTTSTKGYYTYLFDFNNFDGVTFTRMINKQNANTYTNDIQQNFIGNFNIGSVNNKVLIGLDYYTATTADYGSGYVAFGYVNADGSAVVDNPLTTIDESASVPLSTAAADAALAGSKTSNLKSRTNNYSAYISDVVSITKKFIVMAGLRLDYFDNVGNVTTEDDDYDKAALSPKFGIIYQPIDDRLSIFANYQNSYNNYAPQTVSDADGSNQRIKNFEPERANQLEGGVKTNLFNNRLNATISYYDIRVSNTVMPDPDNPNNRVQDGETSSRGFELELNANPVSGLNLRGGYSYNDSELLNGSEAYGAIGKRPLGAGPEHTYNFWASYQMMHGKAKGFGLGFGFDGSGEQYVINYVATGDLMFPSYTVFNGSLFYQADKFRIGFKANNLFDKEYYTGWSTINPQTPRNFAINLTYKL